MKKTAILAVLSITLFACSSTTNEEAINEQTPSENTATAEEETHHHEHEEIVLNNGEKWKVIESMAVYIKNMEKAVNEFNGKESADYIALAKVIDENIESLTSNCTMTGQAHDELHKWLVPFIELSEQFDAATEQTEQEKIYQEIKNAFVEFNTYFE